MDNTISIIYLLEPYIIKDIINIYFEYLKPELWLLYEECGEYSDYFLANLGIFDSLEKAVLMLIKDLKKENSQRYIDTYFIKNMRINEKNEPLDMCYNNCNLSDCDDCRRYRTSSQLRLCIDPKEGLVRMRDYYKSDNRKIGKCNLLNNFKPLNDFLEEINKKIVIPINN